VITVWEPFLDTLTRTGALGLGVADAYADAEQIDAASLDAALTTAAEGAERATAAGLAAQPQATRRHDSIANTLLAAAAEADADVVVMGTRGLSGVKSFLLGSVSHAVTQHADRAVLVVPAPALAERRRDWIHTEPSPG
jgi:nucleotide-binding universal stress UspA family protein